MVIFDEFHERRLEADLGLALTLDARSGLRPELRVLVMLPVGVKLPLLGLYSSAVLSGPPATSTKPLASNVAVWLERAVSMLPVTVND